MPTLAQVARIDKARRRRRGRGWNRGFAFDTPAITFPSSPLTVRVQIALGADLTASHLTWNWLDITPWVRHDLGITIVRGRRDESARVAPSRCTLKLDNPDGRWTRRKPTGPYFGLLTKNTPIWIEVNPGSGYVTRYRGFVNEWPTRWTDEAATDCTVTIECSGALRRLNQGEVLRSPLYRTTAGTAENDYVPYAYWPMEDGTDSSRFASAIDGVGVMLPSGSISFAANSDLAGSDPLPTFGTGAYAYASVPSYTATSQWVVTFAMLVPSAPASETVYAEFTGTGTVKTWRVSIEPGAGVNDDVVWLKGYDSTGAMVADVGFLLDGSAVYNPSEADFYGSWATYVVASIDDSPSYDYRFGLTIGTDLSVAGSSSAGSHGSITSVKSLAGNGASFGHFAVFVDPAFDPDGTLTRPSDAENNSAAMLGWAGELAHERIIRLCREEGLPLFCTSATSEAMGPQPRGTLLDVLRDCEAVDGGVLYEYEYGLAYRTLDELQNQPVSLALDVDAGHIAGTPEPADDDQRLRNQWTISRANGSSYTHRDPDYDSTQGLYADQATVNVETDLQLPDQAGWRVHQGVVDEDRWPQLPLSFSHSPDLIAQWVALPQSGRLTAANPPSQMPPDDLDLIAEGCTERFDEVSWHAWLACTPASTYTVAVYDETPYDSDTSTLAADISTTDTSLSIATTDEDELWTTDSSELPLPIRIGGEVMTVTAISGASSPQTFTVTRSVNGVVKAHAAGASLHVHPQPVYAR